MTSSERFVWCDIETFGLDAEKDPIIEVGFKITDVYLEQIAAFSILIWDGGQYDRRWHSLKIAAELGNKSAKFVLDMHTRSNLWAEALANGDSVADASRYIKDWMDENHVNGKDALCGSSVHFDRGMLKAQLPDIEERFHYRNIDISTLKELCKRLNPKMYANLEEDLTPKGTHRVLSDIDDTIGEARWYFDNFLWTYLPDEA